MNTFFKRTQKAFGRESRTHNGTCEFQEKTHRVNGHNKVPLSPIEVSQKPDTPTTRRFKKLSITSTSSSSTIAELDPPTPENAAPDLTLEDDLVNKIEVVMAKRDARDNLAYFLLARHSRATMRVRCLTAVNELFASESQMEWSYKASKIVACFVRPKARFALDLPDQLRRDLCSRRSSSFHALKRFLVLKLCEDTVVKEFLNSWSFS